MAASLHTRPGGLLTRGTADTHRLLCAGRSSRMPVLPDGWGLRSDEPPYPLRFSGVRTASSVGVCVQTCATRPSCSGPIGPCWRGQRSPRSGSAGAGGRAQSPADCCRTPGRTARRARHGHGEHAHPCGTQHAPPRHPDRRSARYSIIAGTAHSGPLMKPPSLHHRHGGRPTAARPNGYRHRVVGPAGRVADGTSALPEGTVVPCWRYPRGY